MHKADEVSEVRLVGEIEELDDDCKVHQADEWCWWAGQDLEGGRVNTPERVRLMNEDKLLLHLAAAAAQCIHIPCSPTRNNIYHTTVLVR